MSNKKVIGNCLLSHLLMDHRMSQDDLAVKTGIHKAQISEYVLNKRHMHLNSARIIAQALNCYIDDLYEWKD